MSEALLTVRDLKAGYDGRLIVDGIDLDVHAGEIVTMIGPNGAGKSTVLKGIYNMTPARHGACGSPAFRCLTGRRMNCCARDWRISRNSTPCFPSFSIAETLAIGGYLISELPVALPNASRRCRRCFRCSPAARRNMPRACPGASSACSRSPALW